MIVITHYGQATVENISKSMIAVRLILCDHLTTEGHQLREIASEVERN